MSKFARETGPWLPLCCPLRFDSSEWKQGHSANRSRDHKIMAWTILAKWEWIFLNTELWSIKGQCIKNFQSKMIYLEITTKGKISFVTLENIV